LSTKQNLVPTTNWQGFCYLCAMRAQILILIGLMVMAFGHLSAQTEESDWKLFRPGGVAKDTAVQRVQAPKGNGGFLNFVQSGTPGEVKVSKDSRIDALSTFAGTPQNGNSSVKIKGFRIQAALDKDKNRINQLRAEYLSRFNEQPAYIDFLAPNFRLRIGDFRSKLDAQAYFEKIKGIFPDGVIVMEDIDLPRL
jgi:hypothetical protein